MTEQRFVTYEVLEGDRVREEFDDAADAAAFLASLSEEELARATLWVHADERVGDGAELGAWIAAHQRATTETAREHEIEQLRDLVRVLAATHPLAQQAGQRAYWETVIERGLKALAEGRVKTWDEAFDAKLRDRLDPHDLGDLVAGDDELLEDVEPGPSDDGAG